MIQLSIGPWGFMPDTAPDRWYSYQRALGAFCLTGPLGLVPERTLDRWYSCQRFIPETYSQLIDTLCRLWRLAQCILSVSMAEAITCVTSSVTLA